MTSDFWPNYQASVVHCSCDSVPVANEILLQASRFSPAHFLHGCFLSVYTPVKGSANNRRRRWSRLPAGISDCFLVQIYLVAKKALEKSVRTRKPEWLRNLCLCIQSWWTNMQRWSWNHFFCARMQARLAVPFPSYENMARWWNRPAIRRKIKVKSQNQNTNLSRYRTSLGQHAAIGWDQLNPRTFQK